jgi:hypothetical protein
MMNDELNGSISASVTIYSSFITSLRGPTQASGGVPHSSFI